MELERIAIALNYQKDACTVCHGRKTLRGREAVTAETWKDLDLCTRCEGRGYLWYNRTRPLHAGITDAQLIELWRLRQAN